LGEWHDDPFYLCSSSVGEGHQFFDEGQWLVCASAGEDPNGKWHLEVIAPTFGKSLPEGEIRFRSLGEAKNFVAEYFATSVVDCEPNEFPSPENL
jgi:hypothetical protein